MDVLMPQLGETVAEGTVANWHKQEGDTVEADEILLDVETDKVSMEIPAPKAGTLTKILVPEGETVEVGTVLAVIQAEGESAAAEPSASAEREAGTHSGAAAGNGSGTTNGSGAGAEPAASSNDSDASAESSTGGPSGQPASTAAAASSKASSASPSNPVNSGAEPIARIEGQRLSPAVRRLIAEHGLDVSAIEGSGRNGRVTRRNVIEFIEAGGAGSAAAAAGSAQASAQPAPAGRPSPAPPVARHAEVPASGRVPFNRIRKLTADHMVKSKATSPHVLQAVEVDFAGVDRVRKAVKESFKAQRGYSLTYLPFIAHAVCQALGEFPHANASVGDNELILHSEVNLAIAIDLGADGLVAPVIKAAGRLSLTQLAESINDLAARARSNRLKPDDLSGGTYTLSNSGTFGTLITAPVINQPQVAILSTDGVRKKPVVIEHPDGDSIAIRPVGVLAQSFDHRAFDGAYSAAFLDRIRKLIELTDWFREI